MAKRKRRTKRSMADIASDMGLDIPDGITIQPISLSDLMLITSTVRDEFIERGEPIEPPTYEVPIAGGVEDNEDVEAQKHEHFYNEETGETSLETDEDWEAWHAYQDALDRMNAEIGTLNISYMFDEAIEIDWDKFAGWEEKKKKYKIPIPDDPDEKRNYFLTSVAFKTPEQQNLLTTYIARISMEGADPEKVQAMEEFFLGSVEEG